MSVFSERLQKRRDHEGTEGIKRTGVLRSVRLQESDLQNIDPNHE